MSVADTRSPVSFFPQLIGGSLDNYVREVSFVMLPRNSPPAVLQASTNLSIRQLVTCDERISYTPDAEHPEAASIFAQHAYIRAQGKFKEGEVMSWLGKKVEQSSWERFVFAAAQ